MMKRRFLALTGILLLFGAAPSLSAQDDYVAPPVQVSTEKVRRDGKVYLAHPVQERQTLYGISRAYNVPIERLYEANPDLLEKGLQKGSILLIPTDGAVEGTAPAERSATGYWEHTVKWYESLDDIASAYDVTPEEIMAANGLTSRKVTKRQVLRIPVKGTVAHALATGGVAAAAAPTPVPATPKQETVAQPVLPTIADPEIRETEVVDAGSFGPMVVDKLRVQKAEPKQTVAPPEIPQLSDPVLSDPVVVESGTYTPLEVDPLTVRKAETLEKDTTAETGEKEGTESIFDWFNRKGNVDMALVLPFNASGAYNESNMDFYSGVLLALRDLQAEGIKVNLNVYDLQAGLPSGFELAKNDFILGPVSTKDLTSLLEKVEGRTAVVSPLDQRAAELTLSHNGFIQAPSAAASQYTDLARWAAQESGRGDKIILVTEKVSGSTAPAVGVRNALLDGGIDFEGVSYTQAEGRSLPSGLASRMTKGGVNRVIVASEKEEFISDAVRNLGILRGRGYDIVMYAPSRVRTFDTIDGAAFHQNNLHITSSYFVDYDDPKVRSFVLAYRALYRTEPSQFAFQGYDTTRYFVTLCAKYGSRWMTALPREQASGLHTDFLFVEEGGGYRNTAVRRVVYNKDYSTGRAR